MTEPRTAAGLTRQELLDLFDRTAGQPLIREAIRRTLQPEAAARASLDVDVLARALTTEGWLRGLSDAEAKRSIKSLHRAILDGTER